ncbi:glycosyltransferase family 4 protein [Mesotoga sp. B105.6.4]|uniref:glycosyltransferase family 4 protein n=1 Tax=Mesotoga sp. B105.6.4 TaxID=1582224 RepID=UPI000CCC7C6F|nr:glycosyltransferase family 4 protein [Mesotoga sp. B105.6.4]PNS36993.1 hypothetical protein RJ60_11635 [Mesotoga sp. B105.6.4]
MRILVITQNYPPDLGAGSFRMKALVSTLISRSHEVFVISGTPNRYDSIGKDSSGDNSSRERIIRIPVPQQKQDLLQRGLSYFGFFRKATKEAKKLAKDCDVIVATSPQLLVAYAAAKAAKQGKKPFVLDIRDLWPDVMIDLNIATRRSFVYKTLKRVEEKCYQQSTRIIVNSPAFEEHIKEISNKSPVLITNGIDDELFSELQNTGRKVAKEPFTITYAGNLGIAQNLEVLLRAAEKCNGNFRFRLIGDGSEKAKIVSAIRESRIHNIELIEPVRREELAKYYAETDAFFVHLKNIEMFKKTIPSKIFEYVATGKPVLYGLQGVAKEIMNELQGPYLAFEPGDVHSLLASLDVLHEALKNPRKLNGLESTEKLKEKYLRSVLSNRFADEIEESVE